MISDELKQKLKEKYGTCIDYNVDETRIFYKGQLVYDFKRAEVLGDSCVLPILDLIIQDD